MITVEADVGEDWAGSADWQDLADRAVRTAIAHSGEEWMIDSALMVEVSVKFTSDAEVQGLNAGYRAKDRATNVLSFPMIEPDLLRSIATADAGEILLGDVVLAQGVCSAEAAEKRISVDRHAAHLIVHGVLHLLGYDHVGDEEEAEAMERVEREALAAIGIPDPYAVSEVQS